MCFLVLLGSTLWASDFQNWNGQSGQAGLFFIDAFSGPRQQSLGGAGGSLTTTDPLVVLINPATVDSTSFRHHFSAAGETGGLKRELGLIAWNFKSGANLYQATFAFDRNHPIEGLDENGVQTGKDYRVFSQVIQLSAVQNFSLFRFGASAKFIQDHLSDDPGDQDAMGAGLDWGIVWNSPSPRVGFGFSVLNLGRQFRAYTTSGVDDLALNTRVRFSGHVRPSSVRGMTILLDADFPRYSPPIAHIGAEYLHKNWLALRGGLERPLSNIKGTLQSVFSGEEPDNLADPGWAYGNIGFGVRWARFTLDYALVLMRYEIGQVHKVSLRSGF